MAKIIRRGSAKPDDPIYSVGFELFSPRAFRPFSPPPEPTPLGCDPNRNPDQVVSPSQQTKPEALT